MRPPAFSEIFQKSARHPVWTLIALGVISAVALLSLRWLVFADPMDAHYAEDNPARTTYDELTRTFVTDQVILVALTPPDELFTHDNLTVLRKVSTRVVTLPGVDSVLDLTTADYFREGNDTFSAEPLIPIELPTDPTALAALKARAMAEPLYRGGLLSHEGGAASIHVRLQAGLDFAARDQLIAALRQTIDHTLTGRAGWQIRLTGRPYHFYLDGLYNLRDLKTLLPVVIALTFVLMLLVLRRWLGAAMATLGCCVFSLLATAVLVLSRGTMNNCTALVPVFAFIIAVTIVIHFFNELRLRFLEHGSAALERTIAELALPVAYANISTAVGFASLMISGVPAIHQFGLAMGINMVLIVFVLLAFCTAVARLFPVDRLIRVRQAAQPVQLISLRIFERMGQHLFAYRWRWLVAVGAISIVTLYGVSQIRIETNTLEMLHASDPNYQASTYYSKHFGGTSSFYVVVTAKDRDALKRPEIVRDIDAIERYLTSELHAGYTLSLSKFLKAMHRAFLGGGMKEYVVPDTPEKIEQLLLINTNDDIYDVVNRDFSRAVVLGWVDEHSSSRLKAIRDKLVAFLAPYQRADVTYQVSGTAILESELFDDLAHSTFTSFLIALAVIFLLRLVQFRHVGFGALSLLPNAFPIWSTVGMMGLFDIALNVSTSMSAAVTLGIADDETIHCFAQYKALRERGLSARAAALETLKEKGSGMFFSTVVITISFSTLLLSNFGPTAWFGAVLAISMVVALFANVVLGTVLLDIVKPLSRRQYKTSSG